MLVILYIFLKINFLEFIEVVRQRGDNRTLMHPTTPACETVRKWPLDFPSITKKRHCLKGAPAKVRKLGGSPLFYLFTPVIQWSSTGGV